MYRNTIKSLQKAPYRNKAHTKQPSYSFQPCLKLHISSTQHINIPISMIITFSQLNKLIKQTLVDLNLQKVNDIIGFQKSPQNFNFDYCMKNQIGNFQYQHGFQLHCIYRNHSLQQDIIKNQNLRKKQTLTQATFYQINKYKICCSLSSGGFSRVYLVRNLINGQFFAAKFMQKNSRVNMDRQQAIKNQFLIHKSLEHPYIIKMQQYIQTLNFYILIMQYCPGGQLFTLLKNNRYMLQSQSQILFCQSLLAIQYLHKKSIVFRDIKPQNILIDRDGNAKLTDFGLAKQIREKTNSYCGSIQYMAPQIVNKQQYDTKVDLYCMGALLYQILIGCPPFYNPNFTNSQTKYHITNSQVAFPDKIKLTRQVKDLITRLLVKNPNFRLGSNRGASQIFQHPWMQKVQIDKYLNKQIKCPFVPNLNIQNFDRQQDMNEKQFRSKIFLDLDYCKNHGRLKNFQKKFNFNILQKRKSNSIRVLYKKKSQSLDQNQLINQFNILTSKCNNGSKYVSSQNPYKFSLIKSKSQFNFFGQKTRSKFDKKRKSLIFEQRASFDPFEKKQSMLKKSLMITNKSCDLSKKSSVHKKYIKSPESNYGSNRLQLMSIKNHHRTLSINQKKPYQLNESTLQNERPLQIQKVNKFKPSLKIQKTLHNKQNHKELLKKRNHNQRKFRFQDGKNNKDTIFVKKDYQGCKLGNHQQHAFLF